MEANDNKEFSSLGSEIEKKEARKLLAKKRRTRTIWAGFAMFGLIGWSIVLPTLAGILIGIWLDKHFHGKYSWTLTLLITGLVLGCINAWNWVSKENKQIQKEQEKHDEMS